jgi:septal ring factor EnvC (AmiA/AmiB activator)
VVADRARGRDQEVTRARAILFVLAMLGTPVNMTALAQDIRGLEVCTAEKDMARRTSCLQANVDYLQQELTKQTRKSQADLAAAMRDIAALKADVATLKTALDKTQAELVELKKPKPPEKK